ncbi:MAG TPA: effector-associated domain EAD1-containing protein [Thermoanaerobaculia bacterium]|jgi:hypothetical protein
MKLTQAQLETLRTLILTLLPTKQQLRQFLSSEVGSRELDHYALGDDLRVIVWGLLRAASTANPPFLGELVAAFARMFAHDADVQQFMTSLAAPAQRATRTIAPPYYACFITNGPFVDREPLRPVLERLHAPAPNATKKPRILVVTGGPNSGKTHTKYLLNHLGEQFGFQPAIVDFSRSAKELTPEDLGQRIATRLGLTGMPAPGNEQITRWTMNFFDWFVAAVEGTERWLVLDFGRISISSAVTEFIDELAMQVNDSLPKMRLVLLGYAKPLTTAVKRIVEQDDTKAITERELATFFAQFYREYGPDLDDEELTNRIAEYVPRVLQKMQASDEEARYSVMEDELNAICDAIGKEA